MTLKRTITSGLMVVALALDLAASRTRADDIWPHTSSETSTAPMSNATNTAVTVDNVAALPTANNQIELTAQARSSNPHIIVSLFEYFLDSTNNIVNGRGIPLHPATGYFNSAVVTAKATLTISVVAREHQVFVHACSSDQQWSPFVTVILPPSVDDLANRSRLNNHPAGR